MVEVLLATDAQKELHAAWEELSQGKGFGNGKGIHQNPLQLSLSTAAQ